MSKVRQLIELQAPTNASVGMLEKFTLKGFTCPNCHGNGWYVRRNDIGEWESFTCPSCEGTGEIAAEITVRWGGKEETV